MEAKRKSDNLPPGFRFHPTDEELIIHYLKNQVMSRPCLVSIIPEVDIYKFDPWQLPDMAEFGENEWYFFTPRDRKYPNGIRPNRATVSGYWKATGTDKSIYSEGKYVGIKKALVFYKGRPPKGTKTNWIMHEYRLIETKHKSTIKPHGSMKDAIDKIRPPRADWYEELFASVMNKCMKGYESEIGKYKRDLFGQLKGQAKEILEIGIGTGPNLKYYAGYSDVRVIGVDPNQKMEKYAREAAEAAGLVPANFDFVHAVGEILPVKDASVDAVIGTLVLCSVKDVHRTLQEVKRVLKPGGMYVFIEHVAAEDGTFLRLAQNILNPVQQLVGDNCHLTRESGKYIAEAGFSEVISNKASIPKAFIVNPQVYGIARK